MSPAGLSTIGFIGSGMVGGALARLAVSAGYEVLMSNSRGPDSLAGLVDELGEGARAATTAEAARAGDLVVVSVPMSAYRTLAELDLRGRTVVDTTNYVPMRDGRIELFERRQTTSSENIQGLLRGAHVVKALNTILYSHLHTLSRPPGAKDRSALPIAGDDVDANLEVSRLLDAVGFDTVDIGDLASSWRMEIDTPVYVYAYLPPRPEGLTHEQEVEWFFGEPGLPAGASRIAELVAAAKRPAAADKGQRDEGQRDHGQRD